MHSIEVPVKYRSRLGKKIYREAKEVQHRGVSRCDQTKEFRSKLQSEHFKHKVHFREGTSEVIGISWIDTRMEGYKSKKRVKVLSKDVTFGVIDQNSGFAKLSTICSLNADHTLDPLCFSILLSETEEFFYDELSFFKEEYSWLNFEEESTTWFVDGDRGNINAIERTIPNCAVTLCLYHFAGTTIYIVYIHTLYVHCTWGVHCTQI